MSKQKDPIVVYRSLKPGDKLKFFYQKGNINNRVLHVRGRVDNVLVVRRWSKSRGWIYVAMQYWDFQVPYSIGSLRVIKSDKYTEDDQSGAPPLSITIQQLDDKDSDKWMDSYVESVFGPSYSDSIEVEYKK